MRWRSSWPAHARLLRLGRLGRLLGRLFLLECLATPIDRRQPENSVGRVPREHLRKLRPVPCSTARQAPGRHAERSSSSLRIHRSRHRAPPGGVRDNHRCPSPVHTRPARSPGVPAQRRSSCAATGCRPGLGADDLPPDDTSLLGIDRSASAPCPQTHELIDPAGPTFVMSRNGIATILSSRSSYGLAKSSAFCESLTEKFDAGHLERHKDAIPHRHFPARARSACQPNNPLS